MCLKFTVCVKIIIVIWYQVMLNLSSWVFLNICSSLKDIKRKLLQLITHQLKVKIICRSRGIQLNKLQKIKTQ